jgi:hypothetical protein
MIVIILGLTRQVVIELVREMPVFIYLRYAAAASFSALSC